MRIGFTPLARHGTKEIWWWHLITIRLTELVWCTIVRELVKLYIPMHFFGYIICCEIIYFFANKLTCHLVRWCSLPINIAAPWESINPLLSLRHYNLNVMFLWLHWLKRAIWAIFKLSTRVSLRDKFASRYGRTQQRCFVVKIDRRVVPPEAGSAKTPYHKYTNCTVVTNKPCYVWYKVNVCSIGSD